MAVDTRNKRASSIGLGLDSLRVRPNPDGTISRADRLHLTWLYSGSDQEGSMSADILPATLYIKRAVSVTLFAATTHPATAYIKRGLTINLER